MPHKLTHAAIDSPLGDITLILRNETILICEFSDREARVTKQLKKFYSEDTLSKGDAPPHIEKAFKDYFSGNTSALDVLVGAPMGTPYEQNVWQMLREIPSGNTSSYGAIAKKLGSSPRAVGRANGRNPIGLIYPCHRVIGADGSLTGYAGGLERKEWLLKHEGVLLNL